MSKWSKAIHLLEKTLSVFIEMGSDVRSEHADLLNAIQVLLETSKRERCATCQRLFPLGDIEIAIKRDWSPSFFDGYDEYCEPVCSQCVNKYFTYDDELAIKPEFSHLLRRKSCQNKLQPSR